MSTYIDIMGCCDQLTPELEQRLSSLRGEDVEACCEGLDELLADATEHDDFAAALDRFKALADENRLAIASMLKRRPGLCGCELQAALGLTHPTVSHHARTLLQAGLAESERTGRWVHYRLSAQGKRWVP